MSEISQIPFLDLVTPHERLKEDLVEVFKSALSCAGFIGGPAVAGFEQDFAAYCESEHCVGVGSGTDALRFALLAAGVRDGEIVVTVPNTFIATTEAISQTGARPVFVDVVESTYNMDPEKLREYLDSECYVDEHDRTVDRKLRKRVAAVVPVHLYGQMADMDPILELAERYNLVVIEDACQAHGAEYFSKEQKCWKKAGSMGMAAAFSFYPGKNLGACGEGGAVITKDSAAAQKMRMLRDHGQSQKYYHDIEGYNGRLDAIQAGILQVKLRHLAAWNAQRRKSAQVYRELFGSAAEIELPVEPSWSKAVYHLFVVRVANRLALQRVLAEAGIGTAIHYPVALHLQKAYQGLGYTPGDYPVAERVAGEILSLPMYPGLTYEQQAEVVKKTLAFTAEQRGLSIAVALGSGSH